MHGNEWATKVEVLATARITQLDVLTYGPHGWIISYADPNFFASKEAFYLSNPRSEHYNVVTGM